MEQSVTIKGTKSGIILVLDPKLPFEALTPLIQQKFKDASAFLGKNELGLLVRGRVLTETEMDFVVQLIHENTDLNITCALAEKSTIDSLFIKTDEVTDSESPPTNQILSNISGDDALVYKGNIRPGQDVFSEKSIVILGDVKPGSSVTSDGNIFVLGELRGNAAAGAGGDEKAVIMAIDLEPIQLKIASFTAVSPDAEKGERIKVKRKLFERPADLQPEIAYIEGGHIVKSRYGASFLRSFYKLN